ncbi:MULTISPECIES: HNH endonuclease [unclassified Shinella]|uniref:HNH endonuclease n=1 Tax=unclassified Shinella TaxID=2643062 RepID=UPI0018D07E79|nr:MULTISPECIES: HNH endonuclease [unclassified Shinella]
MENTVRISLQEIEGIVGKLPKEAWTPQFWANAQAHQKSRRSQWLGNGRNAFFEPNAEVVRFVRQDIEDTRHTDFYFTQFRTSSMLDVGTVYTREQLRDLFGIKDSTLNNGVFRPKGTESIWLFITEHKTADRTQYRDRLDGDILYWQGQNLGRTDNLIVEHADRNLELLVFFRTRKYEFPGAGFRYFGPFAHVSHQGPLPTSFILKKISAKDSVISPEQADLEPFDPDTIEDARERFRQDIARRRGQQAFRDALLSAYGGRCAISDCAVKDVLEAAHITPYKGTATNAIANGLLLRSDLHTLFDCGLIAVNVETMQIVTSNQLAGSSYANFDGQQLRVPTDVVNAPSMKALKQHRDQSRISHRP